MESSFWGEFHLKARKVVQGLRICQPNFVHVFLGLFRGVSSCYFSFQASCTAFWGSLCWDLQKPVENGETLSSCQEYKFSLSSINAHGTTKFEGDLSFCSKDRRETVTRIHEPFVRIIRGNYTTPKLHITETSQGFGYKSTP